MHTVALIVAAGQGERAKQEGQQLPKQYRKLQGKAVLDHTIARFLDHSAISKVLVSINPDHEGHFRDLTVRNHPNLLPPVHGGTTRQASVFAGLQALQDESPDYILIHDAVRPFTSVGVIDRLIAALETEKCVLPAIPVTDTLQRTTDVYLTETVDRSQLARVQTPQAFQFDSIVAAHEAAQSAQKLDFTDDSSIARWHGQDIHFVEGSERNIKITTPDDFTLAEALLMTESETDKTASITASQIRVGSGYDVHAFEPGDAVILCGVTIPYTQKLKGHSDADVGMHALTDAIFGALCDGDIGSHFPPSDPKWKGADSTVFLEYAAQKVAQRGGQISHADVTLICQSPKIGPHRDQMREKLASILKISVDNISVKATTTERLGFTGREEGIAAMASATICLP